jgi:GNAT superfamily N-acetyltransferase
VAAETGVSNPEPAPVARRATPRDAAALLDLRVVMESAFRDEVPDGPWRRECVALFERRLAPPGNDFAAFVVDGPDGVPVSSGVGWVEQHLPGPSNPTGRVGYVASMSTRPQYRRRGYARAVLGALMGWFDSVGIVRVTLTAAPMGQSLYRSTGFGDPHDPILTWRRPRDKPSIDRREAP